MVYILTKKNSPLVLFSGSKVKEQLNFEVSIRFKVSTHTMRLCETSSAYHLGVNRVFFLTSLNKPLLVIPSAKVLCSGRLDERPWNEVALL